MVRALKTLVVEDEMAIALLIEDMLLDMGHSVVGLAMRLQPALQLARTADIDFAILDINLDGQMSFPVADALTARGVPFAFASGYGPAGLEPDYKQHPVIKKPFGAKDLARVIERAGPDAG